jgi:hypothetical protein
MINEGQKQGLGPKSIINFTRHRNYATAAAYERPSSDTRDTVIKLAQNVDDIIRPVTKPAATATIPRQQQGRQQDIHRQRGSRVSFGSSFDNQEYLNQSFDTSSSNRRPSAMQRTGTRSMSPPPVRHGTFFLCISPLCIIYCNPSAVSCGTRSVSLVSYLSHTYTSFLYTIHIVYMKDCDVKEVFPLMILVVRRVISTIPPLQAPEFLFNNH